MIKSLIPVGLIYKNPNGLIYKNPKKPVFSGYFWAGFFLAHTCLN